MASIPLLERNSQSVIKYDPDLANEIKEDSKKLWELFKKNTTDERKVFNVIELLINRDQFKFEEHKDHQYDTKGRTALHWAVHCGFENVCNLLLTRTRLCIFDQDEKNKRPITMAIDSDGADTMAPLLIKNAEHSRVTMLMKGNRSNSTQPEIKFHEILKKEKGKKMPKECNSKKPTSSIRPGNRRPQF